LPLLVVAGHALDVLLGHDLLLKVVLSEVDGRKGDGLGPVVDRQPEVRGHVAVPARRAEAHQFQHAPAAAQRPGGQRGGEGAEPAGVHALVVQQRGRALHGLAVVRREGGQPQVRRGLGGSEAELTLDRVPVRGGW